MNLVFKVSQVIFKALLIRIDLTQPSLNSSTCRAFGVVFDLPREILNPDTTLSAKIAPIVIHPQKLH